MTVEEKVKALQEDVEKLKAKPKDKWDKLQAASTLISGLLVFGIGYWVKDSIDLAREEQQLQLANVTEMQELLVKLPAATADEAAAAALTLAAFGPPAIGPLVTALDSGKQVPAAEAGLRTVGIAHSAEVCESLLAVMTNRAARFTWITHKSAIRLIRELECPCARQALGDYFELLKGTKFVSAVRDEPRPTFEQIYDLQSEVEKSTAALPPESRSRGFLGWSSACAD
jgi:hypothetical protein